MGLVGGDEQDTIQKLEGWVIDAELLSLGFGQYTMNRRSILTLALPT